MNYQKCGRRMLKVDRRNELAELDDDATVGQMADYFAAEQSGDYGAWNLGVVEYECRRCNLVYQTLSDELTIYDDLIENWHHKAAQQQDPFSSFVFEYLAFIAHLSNNIYYKATNDREAIQELKQDGYRVRNYLALVHSDERLRECWLRIIDELKAKALHNSSYDLDNPEIDKWWNCAESQYKDAPGLSKGVIHGLDDFSNMVEFWYAVRNNLFHGGKDPNIQRDILLVASAYLTLQPLMESEIQNLRRL